MIEDGDRRHRAESCRIKGEIDVTIQVKDHVVGVFVLRDDIGRLPTTRAGATPGEHVTKSRERLHHRVDRCEATRFQPCLVVNRNLPHRGSP